MIKTSIVIVTYNSEDDIKACLDSVLSDELVENEVVVVDNASQDGTRNILGQYESKIKVFYNRENQGYSKANNRGFKNAKGKYIFLLNPDTEVEQGSLKKMFDYMEKNIDVVMLGPLILNPDRTIQLSLRRFPDFRILFLELTGLSRIFPGSEIFNRWRMPDFSYKEIRDVEQPIAAALFLRKSFFASLETHRKFPTGFMDERFSMFFNDVDLCMRVKKEGGRIVFFPESVVMHKRGRSTEKVKEKMIPFHTKGLLRFFSKHRKGFLDKILLFLFLPWIMMNTVLRLLLLRFFNKDF